MAAERMRYGAVQEIPRTAGSGDEAVTIHLHPTDGPRQSLNGGGINTDLDNIILSCYFNNLIPPTCVAIKIASDPQSGHFADYNVLMQCVNMTTILSGDGMRHFCVYRGLPNKTKYLRLLLHDPKIMVTIPGFMDNCTVNIELCSVVFYNKHG